MIQEEVRETNLVAENVRLFTYQLSRAFQLGPLSMNLERIGIGGERQGLGSICDDERGLRKAKPG
jgi:hypothetical protein